MTVTSRGVVARGPTNQGSTVSRLRKLWAGYPLISLLVLLPWGYVACFLLLTSCWTALRPTCLESPTKCCPLAGALPASCHNATDVSFEHFLQNSTSGKRIHNYGFMYAQYFDTIRHSEVAFLEIGLRQGDSIDLWLRFFTHARLYGIDKGKVFQGFRTHIGKDPRVKIFIGDQGNVTFLRTVRREIQAEVGQLDFIIDDGGHTMHQQITSFTHLMPLVKPGGTYFIEDLETSYYSKPCGYGCYGSCCGGGPVGKRGTTIALIKSMLDVLNEDFLKEPNKKGAWGIGHYSVNPADHLVGSIQCWRNMCALRKKQRDSYF